jgi:hypothetical protein
MVRAVDETAKTNSEKPKPSWVKKGTGRQAGRGYADVSSTGLNGERF